MQGSDIVIRDALREDVAAIAAILAGDMRAVQLTSNAARKDAHRFYERLGFAQSHLGFKLKLK